MPLKTISVLFILFRGKKKKKKSLGNTESGERKALRVTKSLKRQERCATRSGDYVKQHPKPERAEGAHTAVDEGQTGRARPQRGNRASSSPSRKPKISALRHGEADGPGNRRGPKLHEKARIFKTRLQSLNKVSRVFWFATSRRGDGQNFCHRSKCWVVAFSQPPAHTSFSSTRGPQLISQPQHRPNTAGRLWHPARRKPPRQVMASRSKLIPKHNCFQSSFKPSLG